VPHVRTYEPFRHAETWPVLAADGDTAGGLASSPFAVPLFFFGWATVGLLLALVLVRRGHDTRTMLALGVGLGPLMAVVASDAIKRRDPNSPALLLEPGIHHGGQLDVLVLVQGEPADVQPIRANLEAVRARLGLLTVARAVAYEWTEGDLDNEVVTAGRRALADAADRLPVRGAELSLWPGPVDVVAERFRSRHIGGLVLVATAEPRVGRAVSG